VCVSESVCAFAIFLRYAQYNITSAVLLLGLSPPIVSDNKLTDVSASTVIGLLHNCRSLTTLHAHKNSFTKAVYSMISDAVSAHTAITDVRYVSCSLCVASPWLMISLCSLPLSTHSLTHIRCFNCSDLLHWTTSCLSFEQPLRPPQMQIPPAIDTMRVCAQSNDL
jgi:hypothetical protein